MVELPALEALAYNELRHVYVSIGDPYHEPGEPAWREHVYYPIWITITNHSGCKLYNIVCRVEASGALEIEGYLSWVDGEAVGLLDGEYSWRDLEPGESGVFYVRIHTHASGSGKLKVRISAEVEPYAKRYMGGKTFTVIPK